MRIEDVTKEERDIRRQINRATDGKEQQELSEKRHYINIKLRRLQKALQEMIG